MNQEWAIRAAMLRVLVCMFFAIAGVRLLGQEKPESSKSETKEAKIARALSAAPENVSKDARVVDRDDNGAETVLREGTNGFTCFPGHPGVVGDVTFCANAAALRWESDFLAIKAKPTNSEPGIEYVLLGGSDWSATDPNATSGTPIKEAPHWRILWPFDPKTTGLPTEPKPTGAWIMWAGTPWAHLMINQRP
jgi:hypothetical protein